MDQLELPFSGPEREPGPEPPDASRAAALLATRLRPLVEGPLEVRLGRARRHPVQLEARRGPDGSLHRRLRLHAVFAEAPPEVLDALAAWMRAGRRARRATRALDAWIAARVPAVERRPTARLELAGTHHDLARTARAVIAEPSAGPVHRLEPLPPLGWGRWPTRAPRRRIQLGAFDANGGVVRIHPVLDDPKVPPTVLEFVLFHELLHSALELPAGETAHGPSFRRAERAYRHTRDATQWIERHSAALIERVARRVRGRRHGHRA